MDDSPFARLPPEIRNDMYERVLTLDEPITLRYNGFSHSCGRPCLPGFRVPRKTFALVRVCRGINEECRSIFYASNTFEVFYVPWGAVHYINHEGDYADPCDLDQWEYHADFGKALQLWLKNVGQRNARQISNVQIKLHNDARNDGLVLDREVSEATLSLVKALAPFVRFFKSTGANLAARISISREYCYPVDSRHVFLRLCNPDEMDQMIETTGEEEYARLESHQDKISQWGMDHWETRLQYEMNGLRHFAALFRLQTRKASEIFRDEIRAERRAMGEWSICPANEPGEDCS